MTPTPLLFLGDSPSTHTGLGRILRDLAVHCSTLPQFRVGALGRGGVPSRKLPFMQYTFPEGDQWGEGHIEHVWNNFAGDQHGIIMTIWDPTRLHWFGDPRPEMGQLYKFLTSGRFEKWGYFAVDAEGVDGRLTALARAALRGYQCVLAYGLWGSKVLSRSLNQPVDWLPHGISTDTFQPRDRVGARMVMGFKESDTVIGMVGTNQPRKDWGVAFQTVGILRQKIPNLKFWAHIDTAERSHGWSFPALIYDFGLQDHVRVTLTGALSDTELSYYYSGCDLTILPSPEGFGYPLVESLACGVPVIHGNYGGGSELIPSKDWLVDPVCFRLEGLHNCQRPVFHAQDWIDAVQKLLENRPSREFCRDSVGHLDWKNLWPACWQKWFEQGVRQCVS